MGKNKLSMVTERFVSIIVLGVTFLTIGVTVLLKDVNLISPLIGLIIVCILTIATTVVSVYCYRAKKVNDFDERAEENLVEAIAQIFKWFLILLTAFSLLFMVFRILPFPFFESLFSFQIRVDTLLSVVLVLLGVFNLSIAYTFKKWEDE